MGRGSSQPASASHPLLRSRRRGGHRLDIRRLPDRQLTDREILGLYPQMPERYPYDGGWETGLDHDPDLVWNMRLVHDGPTFKSGLQTTYHHIGVSRDSSRRVVFVAFSITDDGLPDTEGVPKYTTYCDAVSELLDEVLREGNGQVSEMAQPRSSWRAVGGKRSISPYTVEAFQRSLRHMST
jgi:hypothetical protein